MNTTKPAPLYAALKELVDLKTVKVEMEALEATDCTSDATQLHYNALKSRYTAGKEKAWDVARSLVNTGGWVLSKQGSPEPGRAILMAVDIGEMVYGFWDKRLGPYNGTGAYAAARRNKRSMTIEEVEGVVAWTYIQLPPRSLFE